MAAKKKSSSSKSSSSKKSSSSRSSSGGSRSMNALTLLTQDHKTVQELFDKFEKTRNEEKKGEIATQIVMELRVHAQIEEEIFYPAAREAIKDTDLLDEATVEHQGAKDLMAQIEGEGPDDELFEAKVKVLGEYIKHHVKEEQNELFKEVRKAKGLDLNALGEQLMARKQELQAGGGTETGGGSRGLQGSRSARSRSTAGAS